MRRLTPAILRVVLEHLTYGSRLPDLAMENGGPVGRAVSLHSPRFAEQARALYFDAGEPASAQ